MTKHGFTGCFVAVSLCIPAASAQPDAPKESIGFVVERDLEGPVVATTAQRDVKLTEEFQSQLRTFQGLPVLLQRTDGGAFSLADPSHRWISRVAHFEDNYDLPGPDEAALRSLSARANMLALKYRETLEASQADSEAKRIDYARYLKRSVQELLASRQGGSAALDAGTVALVASMRYQYASPSSTLKAYEYVLESTPERYRFVASRSDGVVVVKYHNERRGTGLLIGPNTVLTARHVVRNRHEDDLSVVFDYEEDVQGRLDPGVSCRATHKIESTNVELDLAVIWIQCPDHQDGSAQDARVLSFGLSGRLRLDDPLYVIGHPDGRHQLISDRTFLRFPHRIDESTYATLRANIIEYWQKDSYELGLFDNSYEKDQDGYVYRALSKSWNVPGPSHRIPTLGFEANTTPGSSGSPVFSTYDNSVVGMLFGGARDYRSTGNVSWMRHEAAIPSEYIVKWLKDVGVF